MAKPLRSDNPSPESVQFKHFGVMSDGTQSKGAFTFSIVTNVLLAALIVVIGSAVKKVIEPPKKVDVTYAELPKEPPPPPPPPPVRLPPPPPPKVLPKLEPPKIKLPEPEKVPDFVPEVKMATPAIKLAPAPPKAVKAPPAPVVVKLAPPMAASVPNHDANPAPVRLGNPTNPLKPLTGPAVGAVNLGVAGQPHMPPGNTGGGPPSRVSISGSGAPNGQDLNGKGRGPVAISGLANGVPDGQGKRPNGSTSPVAVNIAAQPAQVHVAGPTVQNVAAIASPPKVTYKPKPVYTEEAKQMHLEGAVSVRIRVSSGGSVQVLAVTRSLGHGLDESARQAIQGTRFTPAVDANGRAIDWEGVVNVNFQMAG